MTTRLSISVNSYGNMAGFTLSFSTWQTESGGISMPSVAELEELKPKGVNFARHRLNSYQFPELSGVGTVGCDDYTKAKDLSDQCRTAIGRVCSIEHTFGSVITKWANALVIEAMPTIGSATVTDSTTATAYIQCRFSIKRMPDA